MTLGSSVSYWICKVLYAHTCIYCIVHIISPLAISLTLTLNRGGLVICTDLIYEYTIYKCPIQGLRTEEGGGLILHHGLIIHTIRYVCVFVDTIASEGVESPPSKA